MGTKRYPTQLHHVTSGNPARLIPTEVDQNMIDFLIMNFEHIAYLADPDISLLPWEGVLVQNDVIYFPFEPDSSEPPWYFVLSQESVGFSTRIGSQVIFNYVSACNLHDVYTSIQETVDRYRKIFLRPTP